MGENKICYKCMENYDNNLSVCPHCGFDSLSAYNSMYIAPGTILHERYLVGVLLDYNGEGASYAGYDQSTECKVIIREYMPINLCTRVKGKPTISVNYNNLAKYKAFMAEHTELNKSLARLRNNTNINPVLDMFAENNTTYTIFEHIEGSKMLDYLKENAGEISWEQVSRLFPPLFTTIGILHNAGIIHRAISPDTVYITNKGELRLSGFCVSAVRTANAGLEYELFKGYAAPEQYSASSSSRQGSWTDVYGICALLYRALTGCMPADSTDRQSNDNLCEPSMLNPRIPQHVSRVIMEGMSLNSANRIQTITELVTRLFEQPAPIKSVQNVAVQPIQPVQQPIPQQTGYTNYQPNPNYQQPQYIPPYNNNIPQNVAADRSGNGGEQYRYETVSTVDRLKVPVIIGILLLAILLIIILVIYNTILGGGAANNNNNYYERNTSSVDNVVAADSEETTLETYAGKIDTVMPDLIGKFFEITEPKYKDYFTLEAIYEYNNDYEIDVIFEQNVEPGEQIKGGSTVKVKVSKGKESAVIPEYSGLTISQYENKLKEVGISNYSKVATASYGTADTVSQLQVDGKAVYPGAVFSNKEGKKLIVYYISKDAEVSYPDSTYATESGGSSYTEAVVTTRAAVVTTAPAVQTTTAAPVTEPPTTEAPPVVTEAPPVVTEAPPVVTEAPPVVTEAPPVVTEAPPVVVEPETQGGGEVEYW